MKNLSRKNKRLVSIVINYSLILAGCFFFYKSYAVLRKYNPGIALAIGFLLLGKFLISTTFTYGYDGWFDPTEETKNTALE